MYKTYNCKQLTLASNENLKPHVGDITAKNEEHRIFRAGKTQKDRANVISSKTCIMSSILRMCTAQCRHGEIKQILRIWHLKRTSSNIAYQKRLSFRPITQAERLAEVLK